MSEISATAAALPVSMRASVLSGASSISVEQRPIPAVQSDEVLAKELRMRRNTFLQNITRARKLVAECLERHGIDLARELV